MLVKAIELALNNMKKETDNHKHQVLFQQCLNRLSMIRENFISEESRLEVPGFSEYVIRQDLLREIRTIGDILPHIEKALVTRFRSKKNLELSLQQHSTRGGKENMLRQVPIDNKRVLPRYVCDRIIDHFETLPL